MSFWPTSVLDGEHMKTLKTSEFWSAVIAAILGVFVSSGVLTPEMSDFASKLIAGLVAVIMARVSHKLSNGGTPFVPLPK